MQLYQQLTMLSEAGWKEKVVAIYRRYVTIPEPKNDELILKRSFS